MASKKGVSSDTSAPLSGPSEATQTAAPPSNRKNGTVRPAAGPGDSLSAPPQQALAVFYISQAGNLSQWQCVSPQIETLTGVPAKEWLSKPDVWIHHVHPDDRASALHARQQIQECGGCYEIEYRLVARDGSSRWIREVASITCGLDGKPQYVQGLLSDITARKSADEALRTSEERHRSLIERLPGIAYIAEVELLGAGITSARRSATTSAIPPRNGSPTPRAGMSTSFRKIGNARLSRKSALGEPGNLI